MKLEKILDNLNSLEKNSFIKIIDNIIANNPKNQKSIENILADTDQSGLKNVDNVIISKIYALVKEEFSQFIIDEFVNTSSQLDILIDIVIRDGNCIMKLDWFARLYEIELKKIGKKINGLKKELDNPKSEIPAHRRRDYNIYLACLHSAFYNDITNNRETKITDDELSILLTLSNKLELSQEEGKLIKYMIISPNHCEIDNVINYLKNTGVVFFSKKTNTLFVADETVHILRRIRKKEIADKFFRRILRAMREPQINQICRKYNINKNLSKEEKVKEIINEGISLYGVLENDIFREGTNIPEKKKYINEFWSKNLNLSPALRGSTIEEKVSSMIDYFEAIERDDKVGISVDGYEKLLIDLAETLPKLNNQLKVEFELQDEDVLNNNLLLNYNIKPRDVLDIILPKDLEIFSKAKGIKTRGNDIDNILDAYKDSENLYLENYVNIGFRDMNSLKENGIVLKESDLGLKFEEMTKLIFNQLGFNVDENLKKQFNTKRDKIDILLNLGNKDLILIECKTVKESGYNKFSSVSRQMKAYAGLAKSNDYKIVKSLLIAPDFSDDFINETELEYDLNLSLITASSLINILKGFKKSKKHKQFPYKLLMRDVLIQDDRIVKAIGK